MYLFDPRTVRFISYNTFMNTLMFNHVYRQGDMQAVVERKSIFHTTAPVPVPCHKIKSRSATIYFEPTFSKLSKIQATKMPLNSRILTCSYNRRRARIAPQHHDESTLQTNKPQMNPLKSRPENLTKKLEVVSENVSEWPAIEMETSTPSLDSEPEMSGPSSIFRRRADVSEQDEQDDDMFVLKRANPVYESDDDDYMASPAKRQRTTEPSVLHWGDQLSDDEDDSFSVSFLPIR
jgi:hypothetical protein